MTICHKCKHHQTKGLVFKVDMCGSPQASMDPSIDFVTGDISYWNRGSYTLDSRPTCQEINKGNCVYFEPISISEIA